MSSSRYCCVDHQRAHWSHHQPQCVVKAAAKVAVTTPDIVSNVSESIDTSEAIDTPEHQVVNAAMKPSTVRSTPSSKPGLCMCYTFCNLIT